ncbi:MAG: type II toxin-antitoxin system VapC family toxin [Isosphaeraceae bacterium]|nr:type II toxin-antitoxin system VapC family toxin [Isosphaeraceae bacterium]
MTHLLDTNSCVDHLRHGVASTVTAKLAAAAPGSVVICSVVVGELHYGAHRSVRKTETLSQVQAFCSRFLSLTFDDPAAKEYGRIRAHLTATGSAIGPNDLLIAAIALANDLTLVTNNTREFARVPGPNLEDWR